MNIRRYFRLAHPDIFLLEEKDVTGLEAYLRGQNWIAAEDQIRAAERPGQGNMNYTLRVCTNDRTFILKQSRPWVERYDHIPAPWDRLLAERQFYERVKERSAVASCMPRLLGFDRSARVLMLEDAGTAKDCTFVYRGGRLLPQEIRQLSEYLSELHTIGRETGHVDGMPDPEMRLLNYEHIFCFPLRAGNGLDLDGITPGLASAAAPLLRDQEFRERVDKLGQIYLIEGASLVHGDFFPGSWLRAPGRVWVIDPEFCFFGAREFDWGTMLAHFFLAGMPEQGDFDPRTADSSVDLPLARSFAGVEIMRRLLGVAQLPLTHGLEEKQRLLDLARSLVNG